jgi:hypothetical protein
MVLTGYEDICLGGGEEEGSRVGVGWEEGGILKEFLK